MSRDHLLLHEGEDTIHTANKEQVPMDAKQKRQNFWFYHKWHVLITLGVIVLAIPLVWDFFRQENPDYNIGMLVQESYSEEAVGQLQNALAQKGEDLNGDGKVLVRINQYVIVPGEEQKSPGDEAVSVDPETDTSSDFSERMKTTDPNVQMASFVKFTADVQNNDSMIYFVDPNSLDYFQSQNYLFAKQDYSKLDLTSTDFSDIGYRWSDMPYLASLNITQEVYTDGGYVTQDVTSEFSGLRVCMRDFDGLSKNDKQETIDAYHVSKTLYESLNANG